MVSGDYCLAAEHAERRRSPSTIEFGDAAAEGAKSIKWKNREQDFLTTAAWLGKSVLNLICPTTPRSDVNWLEACSLRPNEYFYDK